MAEPHFIDTTAGLEALGRTLAGETAIAVDTEFIREKTFTPRLEIVQIATRSGEIAIVDYGTLGKVEGDPVAAIFANEAILKVFHAADQDLEMLWHLTGKVPAPIWDTQLVAGLIGYVGRTGLTSIADHYLGVRPATGEALTDWSRRPLRPEQLHYAAEDVRYLLPLLDLQRERLAAKNRLHWAEEECATLGARGVTIVQRRSDEKESFQRIRGWARLDRRGAAILRELSAWRDREAARRNRPPGTVTRDDVLLELARRKPATADDIAQLRGIQPADVKRFGGEILAAIETGRKVPREECPVPPPAPPELDDDEAGLVTLVSAVLKAIAREAEIAPSLVATTADVEKLVGFALEKSKEESRLSSGWRAELTGGELAGLFAGERSVRWDAQAKRLRLDVVA